MAAEFLDLVDDDRWRIAYEELLERRCAEKIPILSEEFKCETEKAISEEQWPKARRQEFKKLSF